VTTTPTPTATPEPSTAVQTGSDINISGPDTNREVELVVDENVAILESSYSNGNMKLRVYSDSYTTLTVAAAPDGSSDQGHIEFRTEQLDANTIVDIRVSTESGVTAWTQKSAEDGRAVYIRKPGDALIEGPYDGKDVRNAGLGAGLGVAVMVLYVAIAAKIGAAETFVREA